MTLPALSPWLAPPASAQASVQLTCRLTKPCPSCDFCAVDSHPQAVPSPRSPCHHRIRLRGLPGSPSHLILLPSPSPQSAPSAPLYPWYLKKCRARRNRCSINAGGSTKNLSFHSAMPSRITATLPAPAHKAAWPPDSHRHFCCHSGVGDCLCASRPSKGLFLTWVE